MLWPTCLCAKDRWWYLIFQSENWWHCQINSMLRCQYRTCIFRILWPTFVLFKHKCNRKKCRYTCNIVVNWLLLFKERKVLWKITLDKSSIFSSPINFEDTIYVTTLGGNLFSLTSDGSIGWKFELDKPVFTAPATSKSAVFVGTCGGSVYCISFNKTLVSSLWFNMNL